MHEQGGEQERNRDRPELAGRVPPRIYVASLADYNDGRLHGVWLDAAAGAEELHAGVTAMLRASPVPHAEEWAIHDFEGFGGLRLHEYESLETVAGVAEGIATHGPAFAAYAQLVGVERALEADRFEERFLGRFRSLTDYAEQLGEDLGWEEELDRAQLSFRPYVSIDYDALGRDLDMELEHAPAPDGGIYLFDPHD